jgi:hypothetical protein
MVMVGLVALTAYDIYARRGAAPIVPWWFYALLLLIVAAIGLVNGRLTRTKQFFEEKPKEPSNLVIHRAVYGAGPTTDIDITESLRKMAGDTLVIPVDNNLVPHDPAIGVRKRIMVEYSYGDGTVCCAIRKESAPGDPVRLVLPEDTEIQRLTNEVQSRANAPIKITTVSEHVEYNGAHDCPLKLRFHLRNDSPGPLDIQYQDYRPELITLKKAVTEIFQVRMGGAWLPTLNGLGHIAVLPAQQFAGWIAVDEGKFNKGIVEEHRGKIGILVLLVNGQNVEIKL